MCRLLPRDLAIAILLLTLLTLLTLLPTLLATLLLRGGGGGGARLLVLLSRGRSTRSGRVDKGRLGHILLELVQLLSETLCLRHKPTGHLLAASLVLRDGLLGLAKCLLVNRLELRSEQEGRGWDGLGMCATVGWKGREAHLHLSPMRLEACEVGIEDPGTVHEPVAALGQM